VWLHVIWATLERHPIISKSAAPKLSQYLSDYASEKGIYMKINYVNAEHVHALLDMPTRLSVEEMMHLLKGSSSHWINENHLVPGRFSWGRGYGVFSVSHSGVGEVAKYIADQEEHHRKKSFAEEFKLFVQRYELKWQDDKTVETVSPRRGRPTPT
jgi:REP element-mobilizing transposase RayT